MICPVYHICRRIAVQCFNFAVVIICFSCCLVLLGIICSINIHSSVVLHRPRIRRQTGSHNRIADFSFNKSCTKIRNACIFIRCFCNSCHGYLIQVKVHIIIGLVHRLPVNQDRSRVLRHLHSCLTFCPCRIQKFNGRN